MKVAVIDYGVGNLASVRRALEDVGADSFLAAHPAALHDANRVVLPGVGAFSECMNRLVDGGWVEALNESVVARGKPLLGICLGMQLLASTGEEGGAASGLGLVPGRVLRLEDVGCALRVPHVGWNDVSHRPDSVLFGGIPDAADFYFVHSYAFLPDREESAVATVNYGAQVVAAVESGNVFGCQFHPEKSSKAGRRLLRNFVDYVPC